MTRTHAHSKRASPGVQPPPHPGSVEHLLHGRCLCCTGMSLPAQPGATEASNPGWAQCRSPTRNSHPALLGLAPTPPGP